MYTAEDGTVSTVLDDQIDPSYEPTMGEIEEYAKFLGIDVPSEPQLLWVARKGLKEPLPSEWKACKTDTEEVYYFNFQTGDSIWEHPLDDVFKQNVTDERSRLQLEGKLSYRPPAGEGVPGIDAGAKAGGGKKGAGGKKGTGKAAALKKGAAGHNSDDDENQPHNKKIDSDALSASLAPLNAKGASGGLSELTGRGTGSLKTLDTKMGGGASSSLANTLHSGGGGKPDVSDILAMNKKCKVEEMLESKRGIAPKNTAAILKEANNDLEKTIRQKLEGDMEEKLEAAKVTEEAKIDEAQEDNVRALKKLQRELDMEVEDEEDNARRTGERRVKKELQIFEEGLDRQKEDLRRTLRTLRDDVQKKEIELDSAGAGHKATEKAVAAKKADIEKEAAEEVARKRDMIHEQWQNERLKAEANTKARIEALEVEKATKIAAAQADARGSAIGRKLKERESELEDELAAHKKKLAEKKAAFHTEMAASGGGSSGADPAYLAAERDCDAAVATVKADGERRIQATRDEFEQKRISTIKKFETERAELAAAVASENASATENAEKRIAARKAELDAEMKEFEATQQKQLQDQLHQFEADTESLVARAKEERKEELQCELAAKQGAKELEAAERKKRLCAQAREEVSAASDKALSAIEEDFQRKVNTLEEHLLRMQTSRRNGGGGGSNSSSSGAVVDPRELESAKQKWLSANPEPNYPPLPSLPPPMQSSGPSGPTPAEIEAAAELAKEAAKQDVQRRIAELETELENELKAHVDDTKAKAMRAMQARLDTYRHDAESKAKAVAEGELKVERETQLRKKKQAAEARAQSDQQLSTKQLLEAKQRRSRERHQRKLARNAEMEKRRLDHAAKADAREVAKILRRRRLRDDLEDKRHAEIKTKEAEIRRLVEDEIKSMDQRLEQVASRLAASAKTNDTNAASGYALSSSQFTIGANPAGSRPATPQGQLVDFPLPQFASHDQSTVTSYNQINSPPRGDKTQMPTATSTQQQQHQLPRPHTGTDSSFGFTAGGGSSRGPTPYGSYQNTPVRGLAPGDSRNQHPPLSSSGSGGGDTQESMRAMIAAAQQHLIDLQRRLDGGNSTPPPTAAHSHRGTPQQQQYQPTSLSAAVAQGVTSGDMRAVSPSYAHQHHDAGRVGSGSGGGGTLASESERISKAWATLDKRKRKLREHKDRMENARADWRMDMTAAKHSKDKKTIAVLKSVHDNMEEAAHRLNEDMRDLQSAVKWLKNYEAEVNAKKRAAAAAAVIAEQQQQQHIAIPTASPSAGGGGDAEMKQLLYTLLSRTEDMEKKISHLNNNNGGSKKGVAASASRGTPSKGGRGVSHTKSPSRHRTSSRDVKPSSSSRQHRGVDREGGERRTRSPAAALSSQHDPMVNKWSTWLEEESNTPMKGGAQGGVSSSTPNHHRSSKGGAGGMSYPVSYRYDPTSGVLPPYPAASGANPDSIPIERLQNSQRHVNDWLQSQKGPAASSSTRR